MHVTTAMRVGELAKRTGISVRTLHYYEEIGLLAPSRDNGSRYRLYGASEIARLQQIVSLRQLGFSLDEIHDVLTCAEFSPEQVIAMHMARLEEQIVLAQRLRGRLELIRQALHQAETVSAEEFVQVIEVMKMHDTYYTPEQREYLKKRAETLGEERIRAVEAEWPQLIANVSDAIDAGTDPADPQVQAYARRWMELVREFTGGDPGIAQSLKRMYENEKPQDIHPSFDPRMGEYMAYINKALAAGKNQG